MLRFNVTSEIVTQESAEHGDSDCAWLEADGVPLRDAISAVFETRTSQVDGVLSIEPSDSDIGAARWISVRNGTEFLTGAFETRSLHFPESATGSSRKRIARLMGARV